MEINIKEAGVCYWVGNHHGTQDVTEIVTTALRLSDESQGWYRARQMPLYIINGELYAPAKLTRPTDKDKAAEQSRAVMLEARAKADFARMKAKVAGLTDADIAALTVQA